MGWKRKQKNRTEHGPSYENRNPGAGSNSTHVARARRWWQNFARRTERRTGSTSFGKFHGTRRIRPPIDEDGS